MRGPKKILNMPGEWGGDLLQRGMKKLSVYILIGTVVTQVYLFVKTHQIVLLKCFYFIVCILHLNKVDFKNTG